MAFTLEGKIEIDLADFWTWVLNNHAPKDFNGCEVKFGVPRIDFENQIIVISTAIGSDTDPSSWANPPKAVTEWENRK
jgi:hypothetical protein